MTAILSRGRWIKLQWKWKKSCNIHGNAELKEELKQTILNEKVVHILYDIFGQYLNKTLRDDARISGRYAVNSLRPGDAYMRQWTIIGSDNGLSPGRRQAIISTHAGILVIGPLGTNFSEVLIETDTSSFKKIHLKMSSGKWRPFCLGLNVLRTLLISSKFQCC